MQIAHVEMQSDECSSFASNSICNPLMQQMHLLTHLSLASFLWDIGKQHSPRCDTAKHGVPSGSILFANRIFIEKLNKI